MDKKVRDTVLDSISIILMFYMLITGIGLIVLGSNIQGSYTYERMQGLMSIKFWGIVFCFNAVLYLIAVLIEYRRLQYIFFIAAGLLGMFLMTLYSIASFDTSMFKIHSFRYILFVFVHFTIVVKGVSAWKKEKNQFM